MASYKITKPIKKSVNKGAWTPEEDQRLAEYIEVHGAKKWRSIAAKAGLNRCEKSCRLRWLNYLRPNIKRGSFTDQEEDLIIRLHKLLGNRWSLIAGRLPGRTDNDIKNYWNSHLSKKIKQVKCSRSFTEREPEPKVTTQHIQEPESEITTGYGQVGEERSSQGSGYGQVGEERSSQGSEDGSEASFNVDGFFNFPNEGSASNMEWVTRFLDQDDDFLGFLGDGSVPNLGAFDDFSPFYA